MCTRQHNLAARVNGTQANAVVLSTPISGGLSVVQPIFRTFVAVARSGSLSIRDPFSFTASRRSRNALCPTAGRAERYLNVCDH